MIVVVLQGFSTQHGYLQPGEPVEVPDKIGQSWVEFGLAKEAPEGTEPRVTHVEEPAPGEASNDPDQLPEDCPGYEFLIAAGVTTITAAREHEDLTAIRGIGKATNEQILVFLDSLS